MSASSLRHIPASAVMLGMDFSTGSVKGLAFDLDGRVIAESRFPTHLFTEGGVSELSLLQLEGQARAVTRSLLSQVDPARIGAGAVGISATHHTAARIDAIHNPVRRAICWNDQTLAEYHAIGLQRLGGDERSRELIGGPWAVRYTLSHLVKDEQTLSESDWKRTKWIAQHGSLAVGYLTGRFDCVSVSAAASTGMLDLRTNQWQRAMLDALEDPAHRESAWKSLPTILDMNEAIGPLSAAFALELDQPTPCRPLVFPTLDDQAAGLIGGGAVDDGQLAIILGNSAVVNSSSMQLPVGGTLDVMKLNWGPYLRMRCYSNGALFLDRIVGENPDWPAIEAAARAIPAGSNGTTVLPFMLAEPSVGVFSPRVGWFPNQPNEVGVRVRAAMEAIAYLLGLAVKEHEAAGQAITRITVSGGIARSDLMLEILAGVVNRELTRLISDEGPALGAAVAALAGLESHLRKQQGDAEPYTAADAARQLVRFRPETVKPRADWVTTYQLGLQQFQERIRIGQ